MCAKFPRSEADVRYVPVISQYQQHDAETKTYANLHNPSIHTGASSTNSILITQT